jgi:hypothetical protein
MWIGGKVYIEMLSSQNACCMLTKYTLITETDCKSLMYQNIFILFLSGDHKLKYYFINQTYIPRTRAGMPLYVSLPNGLISNPPIKWKSEMPPSWHFNSAGAGQSGQEGWGQRSSKSTGLGGSFPYVTTPEPLICTVGGVASLGSISVEESISKIICWWNCYLSSCCIITMNAKWDYDKVNQWRCGEYCCEWF